MIRPRPSYRFLIVSATAFVLCATVSCVRGQKASDTADPGLPFGPTSVAVQPIAYAQDIKPIFDRDCLSCHSTRNARGNYSVSTYADSMTGQHAGDARSSVVVDCSPGGSMYGYFRDDAVANATIVFRWIVVYHGAETR